LYRELETISEIHTFNGTVNASSSQVGGGMEKIRKARGKAKRRASGQPPMSNRHPKSTGIWVATSIIGMSCDRVTAISSRDRSKMIQPATGAGRDSTARSLSRCCQASHAAASMMRGPCPSCSVRHAPPASFK